MNAARTELTALATDHAIACFDMNEADAHRYGSAVASTFVQATNGAHSPDHAPGRSTLEYLKLAAELGFTTRVEGSLHLQLTGQHPAINAGSIQVGDTLAWNHGYTSEVVSIDRQTAKTVWVTLRSSSDDSTGQRRFLKSRLVGFVESN